MHTGPYLYLNNLLLGRINKKVLTGEKCGDRNYITCRLKFMGQIVDGFWKNDSEFIFLL